jgi:putative flippase GtrA
MVYRLSGYVYRTALATGDTVQLLKQFIAFSVIGVIGTAAHFTVLIISVQTLSMHPVYGSIAGFITGAIVNYLLNYHVTFKSKNRHLESAPKFFTVATIGLGLNTSIMYVMAHWFYYLISQTIATAIVLIWNFLCNRFWTFKEAHFVKQ